MPRKTWTKHDESKYEAILKSCKLEHGRKRKGAAKACKAIAAATVERDRGLACLGVGGRRPRLRGAREDNERMAQDLGPEKWRDIRRAAHDQMERVRAEQRAWWRGHGQEPPPHTLPHPFEDEERFADHPGERGFRGLGMTSAEAIDNERACASRIDRAVASAGRGLRSLRSGGLGGPWQAGGRVLQSNATFQAKGRRTAIISNEEDPDLSPEDGEVVLGIYNGNALDGDDLADVHQEYHPTADAARLAARRFGFDGLRGSGWPDSFARTSRPSRGRTLLVDGDHETDLEAFLHDNRETMPAEERRAILRLKVGETYEGGGGAWADWKVKRLRGTREQHAQQARLLTSEGKVLDDPADRLEYAARASEEAGWAETDGGPLVRETDLNLKRTAACVREMQKGQTPLRMSGSALAKFAGRR